MDNNIIKKLADLANPNAMTSEDFIKNYKIVISHVIEIKKMLAKLADKLVADVNNKKRELTASKEKAIADIKKELEKELGKMDTAISNAEAKIQKRLDGLKDGLDGKDADEDVIVGKVLEQIQMPDFQTEVPKLGEEIATALELLKGEDRLNISAIEGIDEKLEELEEKIKAVRRSKGGGTGGTNNAVQYADLTDQCDGITKTFTIPTCRFVVQLTGTQYPIIYRPVIDYTVGNKTITLTDEVSAPETSQTLTLLYIK